MDQNKWISCNSIKPQEGRVVETIIMDQYGNRNQGKLMYRKNLWWLPTGDMYVYYTPTHWREIN